MPQCSNCRREATFGYSSCAQCRTSKRDSMRRLRGYNMNRDLYLARVALGIKVGSSSNVSRRMRQLGVSVYTVYVQKGFIEPVVHQELEAYRVRGGPGRETFDCDMSVVEATVQRVLTPRYTESADGASSGTDSSTEPYDPVEPTASNGGSGARGDDPGADTRTCPGTAGTGGTGTGTEACSETKDEGKAAGEEGLETTADPGDHPGEHAGGDPDGLAGSRACSTTTTPKAPCKASTEAQSRLVLAAFYAGAVAFVAAVAHATAKFESEPEGPAANSP